MIGDFLAEFMQRPFWAALGIFYLYLAFWRKSRVEKIKQTHFDGSFSYAGSSITFGIFIAAIGLAMLFFVVMGFVEVFKLFFS